MLHYVICCRHMVQYLVTRPGQIIRRAINLMFFSMNASANISRHQLNIAFFRRFARRQRHLGDQSRFAMLLIMIHSLYAQSSVYHAYFMSELKTLFSWFTFGINVVLALHCWLSVV